MSAAQSIPVRRVGAISLLTWPPNPTSLGEI
jgi:hypothetical protein